MHPNVLFISDRLQDAGFHTVIVGGAVRDMLLGRTPKDFDLATAARPEEVKRLFRNARIIGRRFQLVHITYPDMIVEVATFRKKPARGPKGMIQRDNAWGSPEQDAFRRDFAMNALSLDLHTMEIIDYMGGLEDVEAHRIRTIIPPAASFREDPVRMLRAVRFQVRLGFELAPGLEKTIRKMAPTLAQVSRHRLAEETQRFITGGYARDVFQAFGDLGLLPPLLDLGEHAEFFSKAARKRPLDVLQAYLAAHDQAAAAGEESAAPTVALLGLLATMADPSIRERMLPTPDPRGEGHIAGKGGGKGPGKSRGSMDIGAVLSAWGFLNGQVQPALLILDTARTLLARLPAVNEAEPLPGELEAWVLLWMLREEIGLTEELLHAGRQRMEHLPVLPILDHHMGTRRRVAGRKAVSKAGSSTHRRRRRGGRRKPHAAIAAMAVAE